ncbi:MULTISPECIES: hypothetical protein [Paraburkholderia]|uniref:hypothetical protein n=1 Tax=Paraburkholderia TaxID=1822464 RepID=UPI002AB770B2|nr:MULTISPECIES: hypothetical protein [Paraburkholderia]
MSKSRLEQIRNYGIAAVFSIILAFPLSGVTMAVYMAVYMLVFNPSAVFQRPLATLMTALFIAVWYGVAIPVSGGFPVTDEGGIHRMNAYPFIIATAAILFFIFCRGRRWFRRPARPSGAA